MQNNLGQGVLTGADFAFPDTNLVKALLAMLSALPLVTGSKHAPRPFGSATWQAGASSDQGIHKTNQYARGKGTERNDLYKTSRAVFLPHIRSLESRWKKRISRMRGQIAENPILFRL